MKRLNSMLLLISVVIGSSESYQIGLGRADVTGPSVEIAFVSIQFANYWKVPETLLFQQMGYAQLSQRGHGIHTRQFARTFIVEDEPDNRIVFVSVDAGMISHVVKRNVVRELQKKYGELYRTENVMISGTRKFLT